MEANDWTPKQVKQYFEAMLAQRDRALQMADDEREKSAAALRNEQQRALDQAERERTKSADNLKDELARAIAEGDDRLREHIEQQFRQIRAALESAEKLEMERLAKAGADINALAKRIEAARESAATAQSKFEKSVEKSFENVNEFREALTDLGKQMATRRELESVAETLGELRSRLDVGPEQLRSLQSGADRNAGRAAGIDSSVALIITLAGLAIGVIAIAAAYVLGG